MRMSGFEKVMEWQFTRVTSSTAFIPQVDGLRCLALLLVFGHHVIGFYLEATHRLGTQALPRDWALIATRSPLINWALNLAFGVQIFFVISGFVLALPFARSAFDGTPVPSTKLYLLRRLMRLEIPYVVNLVFLFLVIVFAKGGPWWLSMARVFGLHLFASLTYLHGQIYATPSWINGVAWTLEIEIQFYLLMPILGRLFRLRSNVPRRTLWFALMFGASAIAQFVLAGVHNARLDLTIVKYVQFFFAGILLADIYLDPPSVLRLRGLSADVLGAGSLAALVYILHWRTQLAWLEPLLLATFFFAVFNAHWLKRLFSLRMLTIPGVMCYSIYLYHIFLIKLLLPFTIGFLPNEHDLWLDICVQFIVLLLPVLLISSALFVFIERPCILLSHSMTSRPRLAPRVEAEVV